MDDGIKADSSEHETVLVVDDEEMVCGLLCDFLGRAGYPHLSALGGERALELFQQHSPSIVITDYCMPGMDGIELVRHVHRDAPDVRIILMTGLGDEAIAMEALRAGASNYIKKPIKLEELLFIIQAHERLLHAQRRRRLPSECLVEEHKVLSLSNDQNLIYAAAYNVTAGLGNHMSRQEVDGVLLALTEALMNAMEHGNFEIGFAQKSESLRANSYHTLLENKLADPELSRRRITLDYHMTADAVRICVKDEGKGFDWKNRPDPQSPDNLALEHGRGLSIMGLFTDEVTFNNKGNEICLVKKLNGR